MRTLILLLIMSVTVHPVFSALPIPDLKKNATERTFSFNVITTDLTEFRELVRQASRLKPYGKVRFQISDLADKNFHAIPKIEGNAWYEYAAYMTSISRFFPHQKIAPFIPAEFVKKNRQLLLAKAKILRENGMEAVFYAHEPEYLPDAFFDAYPEMRGPRVDHPRRSGHAAFSTCFNVKEVRSMYSDMTAELIRNVPEIKVLYLAINDAGSGICWSDEQYSGPNGPSLCKGQSTGQRVAMVMNTLKEGAARSGGDVEVYLNEGASMFSDREKEDIRINLPANCYYEGYRSPEIIGLSSFLYESFPVTGIFNALSVINQLKGLNDAKVRTVLIDLGSSYSNGGESTEVSDQLISLIEKQLSGQIPNGLQSSLQQLREYSETIGGKPSADLVYNAFLALEEAIKYKRITFPQLSTLYWGVTARYINRPLVLAPQLLSEKEESYFLPYVFNVYLDQARMDYADIHGLHSNVSAEAVADFIARIAKISDMLERVDAAAPKKAFIRKMSQSLKMYASIVRSCGNFMEAQAIRDRNAKKLQTPGRPDKEPTMTGDADFVRFNEVMRDELDNTQELIILLENKGMDLILHAKDQLHEDPFLPGPDLIEQLKKKRKIMIDHWLDAQKYFTTPFI